MKKNIFSCSVLFSLILSIVGVATEVNAQPASYQNPLRPSTQEQQNLKQQNTPSAAPQTQAPSTNTLSKQQITSPNSISESKSINTDGAKSKRTRSPAQLANDARMRTCGEEWRANKEALKAKGKNWNVFLKECMPRIKAQQSK